MTSPTDAPPALAAAYDVLLLDLDGVVYVGGTAIPGAPEALQRARQAGAHLAYVTNNASRTPAAVAALLNGMGAPAEPSDVVTSAQAAARMLADELPPKSKVLVIGSAALRLAVRERGLVPVSTVTENPLAVVQGYVPGVGYGAFAEGCAAVRGGAIFVGTNGDATLPTPRGIQPGNGSLLRVIAHACGVEPRIAGKPQPPLHRESVIRTGAVRPLVVGDRLDTDIEAAYNNSTDSLLVLTGVTGPQGVVLAPPHHRPTYIARTLDALLEDYPEVSVVSGEGAAALSATCRGWTAAVGAAGAITLDGQGDAIDGLRALAAAAWAASDSVASADATSDSRGGIGVGQVAAALGRLTEAGL